MKTHRSPAPDLPDRPPFTRRDTALPWIRAMAAEVLAEAAKNSDDVSDVVTRYWPALDPKQQRWLKAVITKDASVPASTVAGNWAAEAATSSNADVLVQLAPLSAYAGVAQMAGVRLAFDHSAKITVPTVLSSADDAAWVAQAGPIPVRQLDVAAPELKPKKIGSIVVFTSESLLYSVPNIERLMRIKVADATSLRLDSTLFGTGAGSADEPKGLLNSISPTAASATADLLQAQREDLAALVASVAPVANGSPISFIASPVQAELILEWNPNYGRRVFASSALANHTVIALAMNCLAIASDPQVRFAASSEAVLHMEGVTPLELSTHGVPATIAQPMRSLWQTDCIALRLLYQADWVLRSASGIAVITDTAW